MKTIILLATLATTAFCAPPLLPPTLRLRKITPLTESHLSEITTTEEPSTQFFSSELNSAEAKIEAAKKLLREAEQLQNRNAKYSFSTNVDDHINDLTHNREEVREGLLLRGSYSYSDGYTKRTVHYEADDKGYRIVKMEAQPLNAEGPQVDLNGSASVSSQSHGKTVQYKVQSVPIPGPVAKVVSDSDRRSLEEVDYYDRS